MPLSSVFRKIYPECPYRAGAIITVGINRERMMGLNTQRGTSPKVVFTAMSKHTFFFREQISAFVFGEGAIPVNPFMLFGYFLSDLVERDAVRRANNHLITKADELWVFGPISDGVMPEIILAKGMALPIRYFRIKDSSVILEIAEEDATYEPGAQPIPRD